MVIRLGGFFTFEIVYLNPNHHSQRVAVNFFPPFFLIIFPLALPFAVFGTGLEWI